MNNRGNAKDILSGPPALWCSIILLLISASLHAEEITYYHLDALGSTVAATDENGALLWKEAYRPYGERIRKEDASTNDLWYTGKPHEEEMGLSYFGARWYDPTIGRFMAIDPVGVKEENIHSFNRYAYANNNPYKFVDPDGRDAKLLPHLGNPAFNNIGIRSGGSGLGQGFPRSVMSGGGSKGSLKNASGNLGEAASAARNQPHQREVTKHANERLKTRDKKVTNEALETAIIRGDRNFDSETGKTVHNLSATNSPTGRGVTTVTNHKGGVVTVMDKGSKFKPNKMIP